MPSGVAVLRVGGTGATWTSGRVIQVSVAVMIVRHPGSTTSTMMKTATRVRLGEALEPFVLAIDIGSTASRGDVFDASGRPLKGGRVKVPHHFTTGGDGTSEIDPGAVVGEVEQILNEVANRPVAGRIRGVAMDTFASSLVGVAKDRQARTPCFPMPILDARIR